MGNSIKIIEVGGQTLDITNPVVMTILNVTPDSFWEGSRRTSGSDIVGAAADAVEQGATIIDVGGYSSRPGAADVGPHDEFERVAKAMKVIRTRHPQMIVSVDTFRAGVVRRVVEEFGAVIVNDISAGELDREMMPLVGELGLPYIAMHMRATPATMQEHTDYDDITEDVKLFFAAKIKQLKLHGIKDIIIDPGFGFAKSTPQNYQLMRRMNELLEFGYPVLSGVSRKSMIYKVLDTTPDYALAGTCALNWESLVKGASIIRVHDTAEAMDIIRLYNFYKQA